MARSLPSRRKAVYRGLELGLRLHVEASLEDLAFDTCTILDAQSPPVLRNDNISTSTVSPLTGTGPLIRIARNSKNDYGSFSS